MNSYSISNLLIRLRPAKPARLLFGSSLFLAAAGAVFGGPEFTAVASKVFNGYVRPSQADGSHPAETYAFGNGGRYDSMAAGDVIDRMPFAQLASALAPALAIRNYLPARDPEKTDLMIMVYWGTTLSSRGGDGRPVTNVKYIENFNARMLGFTDAVDKARNLYFTSVAKDVLDEFEASRYFVVLRAYDFHLAHKEKKLKLLWETRFSILTQGNDFAETLPIMARDASRYFGEQTDGLAWPPAPEGKVRLGETEFLPEKPATPPPESRGK